MDSHTCVNQAWALKLWYASFCQALLLVLSRVSDMAHEVEYPRPTSYVSEEVNAKRACAI